MSSKYIIKKLAEEIRKLSGYDVNIEELKDRITNTEKLDSFLESGPVVCSIFNHATFTYDYISPNVEQMLGTSAEELMALDYREFLKRYLHPEDLQIISLKLFPDVVKFINQHAKNNTTRTSVNYHYRMRTTAGNWMTIEQQTSPIKSDEKGNILLDQSFYTQSGKAEYNEPNPIKLSIFFRDRDGVYNLAYSKTYSPPKTGTNGITQRELDVLKMLAKGKTSSQIGNRLNISESTVITHRKNMLKKFSLKNTSELIAFAFKSGMLKAHR